MYDTGGIAQSRAHWKQHVNQDCYRIYYQSETELFLQFSASEMQESQPAAVFGITSDSSGFFFIFDSLLNRAVSLYLFQLAAQLLLITNHRPRLFHSFLLWSFLLQ
jgi:hypothetical protein